MIKRLNNLPNISWQLSEPLGGDLWACLVLVSVIICNYNSIISQLMKMRLAPRYHENREPRQSLLSGTKKRNQTGFRDGERKDYCSHWKEPPAEGGLSSPQCTQGNKGIQKPLPKFLAKVTLGICFKPLSLNQDIFTLPWLQT